MAIPLEDNFTDIIGKAQRGLKISDSLLAGRAGVPLEAVQRLRAGQIDPETARRVAPVLGLGAGALDGDWRGHVCSRGDGAVRGAGAIQYAVQ